MKSTEVGGGAWGEEARLGGDERDSVGGTNRMAGRLAGIAIETAGDVDGQHLRAARVDGVDRDIVRRTRFSSGAGAEQGVDHPIGACQFGSEGRRVELLDGHVGFGQNLVVERGIAFERGRIGQDEHAHGVAAQVQMPGHDEPVAAVVAVAAADGDRARDSQTTQHVGRSATGVFHQHDARQAVVVDGPAVELAGLVA